eukprot:TRINITY_DN2506_c0_g1_i2.p1 TRINITY_DN2506_c0_g1~~TRINITY_DN2506_c0_g1_i2.p1  ORF type:complete len:270 (+),score=22.08 TRINITY_DN2506_c0_g1_i2:30-839(+)
MSSKIVEEVRLLIRKNQNQTVALQREKYMKNVISFYGLSSPELNKLFVPFYKSSLQDESLETKIEVATKLLSSTYGEEKEFGINYIEFGRCLQIDVNYYLRMLGCKILGKNWKHFSLDHVPTFKNIFVSSVYDWSTCDRFSSMVLGEMIKKDSTYVKPIVEWKDSDNLWVKRASCVSFLKVARKGLYKNEVLSICSTCVKSPERFVQLGNGWVLRDLSIKHLNSVVKFIESNYEDFSREGLRYAIEKMEPDMRKRLLYYNKPVLNKDDA